MQSAMQAADWRQEPPSGGETDRAALGALINLAGKQRMLSHRTVMFLGLSCTVDQGEPRRRLIHRAAETLAEFKANCRALVDGDPAAGLPPLFSLRVAELLRGPAACLSLLERFARRAQDCADRLERGQPAQIQLIELMDLAAGDLLASLNSIVRAFEQDLADATAAEMAKTSQVRQMATSTLAEIERLGLRVRLISFNALVEAARAGDAGRGFGVIAREIKELSEQTQAAAAEVGRALNALSAPEQP